MILGALKGVSGDFYYLRMDKKGKVSQEWEGDSWYWNGREVENLPKRRGIALEEYTEYNDKNRISYNKEEDTMYVWKAPCQGTLGSVFCFIGMLKIIQW